MTMDYGYRQPPEQPQRRCVGLSALASVVLVLAGFAVCVGLVKFAVHEPAVRTGQTSSVVGSPTPRQP